MNKTMIFAIMALIAIVVASSFGVQLAPHDAVQIPASATGSALYVCPAASQTWDSIATAMRPFVHYLTLGFFFIAILLMFNWAWALYQNLLSDKFNRKAFSTPWSFTKLAFWAGVIVLMMTVTPNHFRTVHINGADGAYVLCERDTPGARAVLATAVRR